MYPAIDAISVGSAASIVKSCHPLVSSTSHAQTFTKMLPRVQKYSMYSRKAPLPLVGRASARMSKPTGRPETPNPTMARTVTKE